MDGFARLSADPAWAGWMAKQIVRIDQEIQLIHEFVDQYGRMPHCRARKGSTERQLGQRLQNLRQRYKLGKVTRARIKACEVIPGWQWKVDVGARLNKDIQLLLEFVELHGAMPVRHRGGEERRLSLQAAMLRRRYGAGTLTQVRIKACEAIPGWQWEIDAGAGLNRDIQLIGEFVQARSAFPTSRSADDEGRRLWRQIAYLRKRYKDGDLEPERIKACEAIQGWRWEIDVGAGLNSDIKLIHAFVLLNRRIPTRSGKEAEERRLGQRLSQLRWLYRKGELSSERIQVCEAIPGWQWAPGSGRRPGSAA